MAISVCIPTYNRLAMLQRLLASLEGFGDYPYEIIVADGGSNDGTIEYLKSRDDVTLIEQGELTGSIRAYNACFKVARYEYILWPADDFIAVPEVLIKACRLMDDRPSLGLVAPKMIEPGYGNLPGVEFTPNFLVLSKTHIFRTAVLREMGFFDENYRTYFIDDDSCLSVLQAGYAMIFTMEVGLIHYRVKDEIRQRNAAIQTTARVQEGKHFEEKWAPLHAAIARHVKAHPWMKYRTELFRHTSDRIFR